MRIHKITKYDEGQILIKASDTLFECAYELRDTQIELSEKLYHQACEIGDKFNDLGSHSLGYSEWINAFVGNVEVQRRLKNDAIIEGERAD